MLEHLNSEAVAPGRTVVIGGGGFVGRAVVAALAERGLQYAIVSRGEVDLAAAGATERLAALMRPRDAVVFVSARTPDKGRDAATLIANLRMAECVSAACARVPPSHLVYVSSDAVYASDASPVNERSAIGPDSLHGVMHLAREMVLEGAIDVPVAILRPSLLYGAGDPHQGYGPNRFRREARADKRITLFGNGEEQRDHVHVSDAGATAVRCVLRRSAGVLNVATGASASFLAVAELVAQQFEGSVEIVESPRAGPVTHRHFDIVDCVKAFPDFRFTALADGIARTHGEER